METKALEEYICGISSDFVTDTVSFRCDGDEPFICEVNGSFTLENLMEIESDIQNDRGEYINGPDGIYTFALSYVPAEKHGPYEANPGYWEFTLLKYTAIG